MPLGRQRGSYYLLLVSQPPRFGPVVPGGPVVWWSGGLVVWWSGGLVVWKSGGLVVWSDAAAEASEASPAEASEASPAAAEASEASPIAAEYPINFISLQKNFSGLRLGIIYVIFGPESKI